jgi:hypothetical protein
MRLNFKQPEPQGQQSGSDGKSAAAARKGGKRR